MDQLRQILANISAQLSKLNASHKLAIASIVLVLILLLFVVAQWTGKPDLTDAMPTANAAEAERARKVLEDAHIRTYDGNGKVMVSVADARDAQARLAEANTLPADKALMFDSLIKANSWTNSRQQNEMNHLLALMNELSATISKYKGVKDAKVIIDIPEMQGLGAGVRLPTASVTVWMASNETMPQSTVDGVANFVAGTRAGLVISRVKVIDGNTGKQRKVSTEDDVAASAYLDQAARVEAETQQKVLRLLDAIPGVIVAVTAQVDVTRVTSQTSAFLKEGEGSIILEKSNKSTIRESGDFGAGGEPGPASNQAADINRGGPSGSRTRAEDTIVENTTHAGTKQETVFDPKGRPTMVAVSVNVPKRYVLDLLGADAPEGDAAADAPTKQQVDLKFGELKDTIRELIRNQVQVMTAIANTKADAKAINDLVDRSISVAMIPEMPRRAAAAQEAGVMTAIGGGGGLGLGSALVEKGILAGLGVAAMGMMIVMVRKAGKRPEMPDVEELLGIPPSLEAQADVIGEADEGEMAMDGIEVGDKQIKSQKLLETVTELVGSDPQSAAKMLNRWISVEE